MTWPGDSLFFFQRNELWKLAWDEAGNLMWDLTAARLALISSGAHGRGTISFSCSQTKLQQLSQAAVQLDAAGLGELLGDLDHA